MNRRVAEGKPMSPQRGRRQKQQLRSCDESTEHEFVM